MNSVYNFNLYKGHLLIKATFSGSLQCPLYTGLTVSTLEVFELTLKGSYRIGGVMVVKPALVTTSIMQKLVLYDVMVVR